jgi:hypothetical protein
MTSATILSSSTTITASLVTLPLRESNNEPALIMVTPSASAAVLVRDIATVRLANTNV